MRPEHHKRGGGATYENNLKEHLLVDVDELLVPLGDLGSLLSGVVEVFRERLRVLPVVLTPLDDLCAGFSAFVWSVDLVAPPHLVQDGRRDVGQGNSLLGLANVCHPPPSNQYASSQQAQAGPANSSAGRGPSPAAQAAGLTLEHVLDEHGSDSLRTRYQQRCITYRLSSAGPRTTSWSTLNSSLSAEVSLTFFSEPAAAGVLVEAAAVASDISDWLVWGGCWAGERGRSYRIGRNRRERYLLDALDVRPTRQFGQHANFKCIHARISTRTSSASVKRRHACYRG